MSSILSTFAATLFALLNSLGVMPVFVGYASKERLAVQRFVALLISMTVFGLLALFLFTGQALLSFFGIDLDCFRIAGGILLLMIGIGMVMGAPAATRKDESTKQALSDWQQAKSLYSQIVIPLAMPLLVGPGVIANVVLYATLAEHKANERLMAGLLLVCAGVSVLNFIIFMAGRWLKRILGEVGLSIATRILGLLVASMGVQFMATGVTNLVVHSIAPQLSPAKSASTSHDGSLGKDRAMVTAAFDQAAM
jgi:multiple antibiotic resistance protein